jgi:hypothetical protein
LLPTPQADASSRDRHSYHWPGWHKRHHNARARQPGGTSVPELDAGAAGGAMILLIGGVAYIVSRRREQAPA